MEQWPLIEADLHEVYGIDVGTGVLRGRSWRWLKIRIPGLLSTESRLVRHFAPADDRGRSSLTERLRDRSGR
ncbi:hypothetical protein GCM10018785_05460 [Streptomyces longispororuber]|uniref:Uncharacterized protein n=1 Tax=Streptomyces longispororuber TaxID=68230 RepID=A0A918Z6N2_9ACTN|nr:hypothetical protein [Streptomyces longispororuber]GHE38826.1 hypothetical protein GCM10018785_05460 [Streptomyces longispororuber]